ncbi:MAG: HAMP domain-containing protein [Planctomycetes bacterium]|nr:HAMP domain-containing protein [Planctomycetota bacterium]
MSLRTKIALVLLGVIGVFALANYRIQQTVFFERFEQLEQGLAETDINRVKAAIREEVDDVRSMARGWAEWDALYNYVDTTDPAFVLDNLSGSRLAGQGIDLLFILGKSDGEILASEGSDQGALRSLQGYLPVRWSRIQGADPDEKIELPLFPRDYFAPGHPLATTATDGVLRSGVLMTDYRPIIVASHPIRRSQGDGEPRGAVILGRFLDEDLAGTLSEQTGVSFTAYQADGRHEIPEFLNDLLPAIASSTKPVMIPDSDERLDVYGAFNDIRERPEIILHARIPRDVSATGAVALSSGLLSTITAGAVLLLVLLALMRHIVLGPLVKLTKHTQWIGSNEDFRAKIQMDRKDEIGALATEFDRMMDQLEEARAAYVATARSAGMSQVATGILHNVGNVLSSVNVAAELVNQKLTDMSVGDLEKLTAVIEQHADDLAGFIQQDARGKHLQPFLSALSSELMAQRNAALEEVAGLSRGVEHICELVKSQQSYAVTSQLKEPTNLAQLIDDAARISEQALFKDPDLTIDREYEDLPDIEVDRHKVLEILVNLITNARQAMEGYSPRHLTFRLFRREDKVCIQVQDSGKGLTQEQQTQVFHAGYTTKTTGMGYGLHSSANAATEVKGKLTASSEGPGQGATFTLEFPASLVSTPAPAKQ